MVTTEKIKKSDLGKMLKVTERVIDMHVQSGILPVPSYPVYPETEMIFDRKSIAKALGVKEITDEPFIDADEAAIILGVEHKTVHHYVRKGKIPSYRLKNIRGHKFLFLKSELEALKEYSIEWDYNFANFFFKQFFLRTIFNEILTPEITKDLTKNESTVVREIMINKKSIEQISEQLGLSTFRIKDIFNRACKRIYFRLKQISSLSKNIDALIKENGNLRDENKILKELNGQNKFVEEKEFSVLKIKVSELNFSSRVASVLSNAEINTIGDMMKYSWTDFMKFRNLGINSLKEIEKKLAEYNLTLNKP